MQTRLALRVAVIAGVAIAGCRDVRIERGLPVLAKDPNAVVVSGSEGLPDIDRGNQARMAGRLDDAERDLKPLAERGYIEAQIYLAAVYGQREDLSSQDEAIKWYRAVLPRRPDAAIPLARVLMRRGDQQSMLEAAELLRQGRKTLDQDAVNAATLDLFSLFPELDTKKEAPRIAEETAKSSAMGTRAAAINWYRASLRTPGSARKLIELCRANLDAIPSCFVDLTTYYRYTRDQKALTQLVDRAMRSLQHPESYANFDDLYYDPVVLPAIASRMVVGLIDQPLSEENTDVDEDLALTSEAEKAAAAEAGEGNTDADSDAGAVPQTVDATAGAPTAGPAAAATASDRHASAPVNKGPMSATAHPELADKLLRWMLKQPGAMPSEAAGVVVAFPYLLPDVNIESVLQEGTKAKYPRASLFLGQLYYFNQRAPRDPNLGEANLLQAIQYRETSAPGHYRLGRLYQQGYLGRPDPQKALESFLYAARRRVTAADSHLARLFYGTPGTRIDRVNSYVFARLAEDGGIPVVIHSLRGGQVSTYRLLDRLRDELTPEDLKKAEALYQQERAVHLVSPAPLSPEVWTREVKSGEMG